MSDLQVKNDNRLTGDYSHDMNILWGDIRSLENALEDVLGDASHTGKWNSHGPIERKTWDNACQALGERKTRR